MSSSLSLSRTRSPAASDDRPWDRNGVEVVPRSNRNGSTAQEPPPSPPPTVHPLDSTTTTTNNDDNNDNTVLETTLTDDEDDPIVILRYLRNARNKMKGSVKGVSKGVSKGMAGTQKQLARGTHKVVKRAFGKNNNNNNNNKTMSQSNKSQSQLALARGDVEANLAGASSSSTTATETRQHDESSPLLMDTNLPAATTSTTSSTDTSRTTLVGRALWAKTRQRLDSLVLSQQAGDSLLLPSDRTADNNNNNKNHIASKTLTTKSSSSSPDPKSQQHELKTRIRRGLDISMTHCVVAIALYLVVAVVLYSFVLEHWSIVDSLYFALVTATTIGYGDMVPSTDASRIFTSLYALCGVAFLGVALGVVGSTMLEAHEQAVRRARQISQYRVMTLFDSTGPSSRGMGNGTNSHTVNTSTAHVGGDASETKQWYHSDIVVTVLPLVLILLACLVLVTGVSHWTAAETVYYCIITATTIGFGDYTPTTERERLLAIVFILFAVGAMGRWMSLAAGYIIDLRRASFQKAFENHELTLRELEAMDDDGDGKVTRAEFLEFMLVAMNKVDQDVLDQLRRQFSRLDVDGTGELEREDLIIVAKRKLRSPKRKLQLAQYKQKLLQASAA